MPQRRYWRPGRVEPILPLLPQSSAGLSLSRNTDNPNMNNLLMYGDPAAGLGAITRGMLRVRAVELAILNGGAAQDVSNYEWEQAKLEMTGDQRPEDNG